MPDCRFRSPQAVQRQGHRNVRHRVPARLVRGRLRLYIAVTHSGDKNIDPILRYEFENAVVTASGNDDTAEIVATFRDGSVKTTARRSANTTLPRRSAR